MQKKSLMTACLVAFSIALSAQKINTDSLTLVNEIADYQLKKAKLTNTMEQITSDKKDAATKVQTSANQNSSDAERLSNDPQNKKLAKNSDNSASEARKDSKSARIASTKLDKLNEDIADLDKKIAKKQKKLDVYVKAGGTAGLTLAAPGEPKVIPDSLRHN
jgi:hypothetical protein